MGSPGDYQYFKATVPEQRIFVGLRYQKLWRYYDYGPKSVPPIICIPGAAGTADVFYKQILAVSAKGYRIMAVDAPAVWSHQEWTDGFEKFLDCLRIHQVHLYGTSLGGLLAQLFAQYKPRRVKSLLLSNTFLDTRFFNEAFPWSGLYPFSPEFMLKGTLLSGFRKGPHEPLIADSIDFVVSQLDTLGRAELASRLTLNTILVSVDGLTLPDDSITIMDTNDYSAVPSELRDEVQRRYGGARRALLKSGGDFPFLSRADEVSLHILLHLRRVGLEVELPSQPTAPVIGSSSQSHSRRASTGSMYSSGVAASSVVHKVSSGKGGGPSYSGNEGEKQTTSVPWNSAQAHPHPLPPTPAARRDPFIRVDSIRNSMQQSRSPPLPETSPSGSGREALQSPGLNSMSSTQTVPTRATTMKHSHIDDAEEKKEVPPDDSLRKVLFESGNGRVVDSAAVKQTQLPFSRDGVEDDLRERTKDADQGLDIDSIGAPGTASGSAEAEEVDDSGKDPLGADVSQMRKDLPSSSPLEEEERSDEPRVASPVHHVDPLLSTSI